MKINLSAKIRKNRINENGENRFRGFFLRIFAKWP